jgi:large subunit ribosomal protein L23
MSVLLKPIVSEKFAALNEQNVYGFVVSKDANKVQIKKQVESIYGVSVESVNTAVAKGKQKTKYTKKAVVSGKVSDVKKAYVKIAEGEMIDFYSGV